MLSAAIFGVAFRTVVLPTGEKWMQKTVSYFLMLLLLSLGLFGSLSLTYCVWNKQTEVASELQNDQHSKLASFSRMYKTNYVCCILLHNHGH